MTRRGFLWSVAALLGIACAAAIAWSASLLAGQHIGLSSLPLSAAGGLAPPARTPARVSPPTVAHHRRPRISSLPAVPAPTPSPAPAPASPAPASTPSPAAAPAPPPAAAPAPATAPPTPSAPAQREDSSKPAGGSGGSSSDSRQRDD